MLLQGKTALISGAGRNNGRAIALAFAREGADVILVAQQLGDELNKTAKDCEAMGVKALPILADVSERREVDRVVESGLTRFGKVDMLVNTVGMRPHKNFWEYGDDEWRKIFAVNVHSTFYYAKALAPSMIARKRGSIVALGAVASLTTSPTSASEVASKHSLYGLIKSLALELGPHGIRANLIALQYIENVRRHPEWYQNSDALGDPKHSANEDARTPLQRKGKNSEVANVALFLASDSSSYVTGDRVVCAGGRYM